MARWPAPSRAAGQRRHARTSVRRASRTGSTQATMIIRPTPPRNVLIFFCLFRDERITRGRESPRRPTSDRPAGLAEPFEREAPSERAAGLPVGDIAAVGWLECAFEGLPT